MLALGLKLAETEADGESDALALGLKLADGEVEDETLELTLAEFEAD